MLRDFVAIDEALATCDGFSDQCTIAARMRAAVPVSAQIEHPFPCFGGRPGLGVRNDRTVTAKPVVTLDSGRIDQAAVGHKNTTSHLVHFARQQRGGIKMDARSSLVVVD